MLQKLSGKLTWESAGSGIRVEIPARRNLQSVVAFILMLLWTMLAWFSVGSVPADSNLSIFAWVCLATGAAGSCFAVGWLLWSMTGRTVLTFDLMALSIRRSIAGIVSGTDSFATQDLYDLRYVPPAYIWAFRTDTDPKTSRVQFRVAGKTYTIVRGLTEREECALIDRMLEIHAIPKGPAFGSAGKA
jgi:hypothetical protein